MKRRVGMCPGPFGGDEWSRNRHPFMQLQFEALADQGWEIVPITSAEIRQPERLRQYNLNVLHLHWPSMVFYFAGNKLYRLPWIGQLLVPRDKSKVNAWAQAMRACETRLIWQIHDLVSHNEVNAGPVATVDELLCRKVYERAQAIVVHERSCLKPVFEFYGSEKPFAIAPLGDYTRVHGDPRPRGEAQARLGVSSPSGKILAYVGTARRNRNPRQVVQAFSRVAGADDRLIIAGQAVGRFVRPGRDPRILVFDGMLPNELVRDILCASHFVINHAQRYLTSAVVRAAMSYGTPVIAYPFGSTLDMAQDAAVLIGGEANALEQALGRALQMGDEEHHRMTAAALQRNRERKWQDSSAACVELYSRVIEAA